MIFKGFKNGTGCYFDLMMPVSGVKGGSVPFNISTICPYHGMSKIYPDG